MGDGKIINVAITLYEPLRFKDVSALVSQVVSAIDRQFGEPYGVSDLHVSFGMSRTGDLDGLTVMVRARCHDRFYSNAWRPHRRWLTEELERFVRFLDSGDAS